MVFTSKRENMMISMKIREIEMKQRKEEQTSKMRDFERAMEKCE